MHNGSHPSADDASPVPSGGNPVPSGGKPVPGQPAIRVGLAEVRNLGADAAAVGRAYLYSLMTAGEPGVDRALALLAAQFRRTLELLGVGGRFLGLTAADTSSYTIALQAADLSIPAHQTRADTVSVVR